jgi:hypothetical protein
MGTYGTGTEHAESASRSAERSTAVNMMAANDDELQTDARAVRGLR